MDTTTTTASEPTDTRIPWDSPTVRIVLVSTLLAPLGVPLVSPTLPVVRDTFGVSEVTASLLISAYFVAGIVLSPFIGALADRLGRRLVLAASLVVFGLAGGVIVVAPSFTTVLLVRIVQGTASAGIFVATVTIIGDTFEDAQRNAVLGINTAVLSVGAAIFPVVGGVLVAISWDAPYLLYLLAVPLGVLAWRVLEAPDRDDRGDRTDDTEPGVDRVAAPDGGTADGTISLDTGYARGVLAAVGTGSVLAMFLATFAAELLLFGAILTAVPFLLVGSYGLTPAVVGGVLLLSEGVSVVVSAANGRFARRATNATLVAVGFVCLAVGLAVAWLATSVLAIAAATGIIGAGIGLVLPSVDAEVSDRVTSQYLAGALSLRNSTTFLGRTLGPVAFAGVATTTGYAPLLFASAVVALAVAAVVIAGARPIGDGDLLAPRSA
ncbi:MFS transporter [Natronorubrum aibiense]|uniref:MFS transporter n=1 Tax=Natronorubrum aibiense TaxID=348826 RepID=A0A5P9NZM3_9EURY|nr:MFS transporter [Natronorubrum aibiense]QFU81345.1 MFS transporter [Natronorubrum aibiense]